MGCQVGKVFSSRNTQSVCLCVGVIFNTTSLDLPMKHIFGENIALEAKAIVPPQADAQLSNSDEGYTARVTAYSSLSCP